MNTNELMNEAAGLLGSFREGPRNFEDVLEFAKVNALLAIANELKRMNDGQETDRYRQDMVDLYRSGE